MLPSVKPKTKKKTVRPNFYADTVNETVDETFVAGTVTHSDEQEPEETPRKTIEPVVEEISDKEEKEEKKEFWGNEKPETESKEPSPFPSDSEPLPKQSDPSKLWVSDLSSSSGGRRSFLLLLASFIGVAVVTAVATYLIVQKLDKNQAAEIIPSATPESLVTPTPAPAVDLTMYKISILNGSGVKGEAARLKKDLEDKGFMVDKVGNADKNSYQETVVSAKADVKEEYLKKLRDNLEGQTNKETSGGGYVVSTDIERLEDNSTYEVVVVIGKKKTQ